MHGAATPPDARSPTLSRRPRESESEGRLPPLQLEGVAGGGRAEPGRVDAGRRLGDLVRVRVRVRARARVRVRVRVRVRDGSETETSALSSAHSK